MNHVVRSADLEAYLDEALPQEGMARVEQALRDQPELLAQLTEVHSRRDAGLPTLGELWRRHRLSCPTRPQLGSYLLGALDEGPADYIRFHLEVIGCRYCQANLADLREQQAEHQEAIQTRRRRYFETSAGYLKGK